MQVHLFQMDLAWEDKQANYDNARKLAQHADIQPGDLVVLPEMFDTGFSFKTERTADNDGKTAAFLADFARELNATVHGGRTVIAPDGSNGLNRAHIVAPDGTTLAEYDKAHPFSFGKESERFIGGQNVLTYPWNPDPREPTSENTLTVCPAVCYDLRFPELFRRGLDLGAEAFAIGANWPAPRAAHWRALAIARAIENQAFVFAVNRVGRDPALEFAGGSLIIDPKGDIVAEAKDRELVLSAEVDTKILRDWREIFPAIRDRAPFLNTNPAP